MTALVQNTITVTVVIATTLATAALLRNRSAALRHWMLLAALICALLAPLVETVAPAWRLPETPASPFTEQMTFRARIPETAANAAGEKPSSESSPMRLESLVVPIWLAGAGIGLAVLAIAMMRLNRIAAAGRPVTDARWTALLESAARDHGLQRDVVLLQSDHPTLLVTWGLITPKILLPAIAATWTEERIRAVLSHELAHVARSDWASQMLGELLRSIYWFNPIVWFACRQLRRECEHACDDAVLSAGLDGADYATHLLDLARTLRRPDALVSLYPRWPVHQVSRGEFAPC
jgi:beta-lactamase regulating signal transducer with metallopeptidase domain